MCIAWLHMTRLAPAAETNRLICIAWLHITRLAPTAETNRLICIAWLHNRPPRCGRGCESGLMQVGGARQARPESRCYTLRLTTAQVWRAGGRR